MIDYDFVISDIWDAPHAKSVKVTSTPEMEWDPHDIMLLFVNYSKILVKL